MTYEVVDETLAYEGKIFAVRQDDVVMPGGTVARRDVVTKDNAVAIVAFNDEGQIALIHQYRHPLGRYLWELPAGLIDGVSIAKSPLATAANELREETGFIAVHWAVLANIAASPGFTDEQTTIYLATGLTEVGRPAGVDDEEADLQLVWTDIDEALRMVRDGEIINAHTVAGVLAMIAYSHTNTEPRRLIREES